MLDLIPAVGLAGSIGLFASFLLELLLNPKAGVPWRRHWASLAIHAGFWLVWFGMGMAIVQRPVFSAVTGLALLTLIVMVNNAKFHSLREPFVAQDFEYFSDAIRHPRLYIPFLGWGRALLIGFVVIVAIAIGLLLEPSLLSSAGMRVLWVHSLGCMLVGGVFWGIGHWWSEPVRYQPGADLSCFGLVAYLWHYWYDERRQIDAIIGDGGLRGVSGRSDGTTLPDLVVVQSESFFDPRPIFPLLRTDLLGAFDTLKVESIECGRLKVPAWGANTVRSEFAFLSGLPNASLGVHQFNPYRRYVWSRPDTLATRLRAAGYRTVCIHPYPASFYTRDRVYPKIGFDEFIDIRAFEKAPKFGPYVGDGALAERVIQELRRVNEVDRRPLFIFVITMENHGPLHLEQVGKGDIERLYRNPPPTGCTDLTIYARHLKNADSMFGQLRTHLLDSSRETILCIYGDHVPIMPAVYAQLGTPDGDTDFLIWSNRKLKQDSANKQSRENLPLETLASRLLEEIEG